MHEPRGDSRPGLSGRAKRSGLLFFRTPFPKDAEIRRAQLGLDSRGRLSSRGLWWLTSTDRYNLSMMDEIDFRKRADVALDSLKKSLMEAEESADLEVEDQSGALHLSFEDRSKFIISPNAPVRQIWISALATSFKLDWSDAEQDFVLSKTGEKLKILVARLINQQLGEDLVTLA